MAVRRVARKKSRRRKRKRRASNESTSEEVVELTSEEVVELRRRPAKRRRRGGWLDQVLKFMGQVADGISGKARDFAGKASDGPIFGFPNERGTNACFANASLAFLLRYQLQKPAKVKPELSEWAGLIPLLAQLSEQGPGAAGVSCSPRRRSASSMGGTNLACMRMAGFSSGHQECAQEFVTSFLDKSVESGILGKAQFEWKFVDTFTSRSRLMAGARTMPWTDNMLNIDTPCTSLPDALHHLWTRSTDLTGENQFAVTQNGVEIGRVDARQMTHCTKVPDIAIVGLKFRIRGELKRAVSPKERKLREEGTKNIDLAINCKDEKLTQALVESMHEEIMRRREMQKKRPDPAEFVLRKDGSYFHAPLEINFLQPRTGTPTHALHAIVVHSGLPGAGHYYTFVRLLTRAHPEAWYKVDDQKVSRVSLDKVYANSQGGQTGGKNGDLLRNQPVSYILSYVRINKAEGILSVPDENVV